MISKQEPAVEEMQLAREIFHNTENHSIVNAANSMGAFHSVTPATRVGSVGPKLLPIRQRWDAAMQR